MKEPTKIWAKAVRKVGDDPRPIMMTDSGDGGHLVLVELPPNCRIDESTSEVQAMLAEVVRTLGDVDDQICKVPAIDIAIKWNRYAIDIVERVRTLLGSPS